MSEEEKEQAAREMTQKYFKGAFKKTSLIYSHPISEKKCHWNS